MSAAPRNGPEILVHPPTLSLIAPLLAIVLGLIWPLQILPAPPPWSLRAFGILLILAAGANAIAAERAFRKAKTNVDPRQPALVLVDTGPYRFGRNPMYLGMVILQIGLAFSLGLDWALIFAPALWALLHWGVVLPEEAYLTDRFGTAYEDYLTRTRRWI